MAMLKNHYELLGLEINASDEQIKAAYREKIAKEDDSLMSEYIQTAYYVLKHPIRRQTYDLSIGIHKYKQVSKGKKAGKGIIRVILTALDYLCTFYWCVLLAIVLLVLANYIYTYYMYGTIEKSIVSFLLEHKDEIIVLGGFAVFDFLVHYYIRRANRKLKNYKWEYIIKNEK